MYCLYHKNTKHRKEDYFYTIIRKHSLIKYHTILLIFSNIVIIYTFESSIIVYTTGICISICIVGNT